MVLQRLPLDSGLRYALTTVTRYLIVLVGMAVGFQFLGVGWSSVQWLAAAVSVGLGFGLQDIFANFVSGLIILFERPLRVGDTVTIGDTNGTVTQIRIRGTTIRGWDGKDLVVPNKTILTTNLLNWTLSDSMSRVDFLIAPDYGTDTEKVRRILLEIAAQDPRVMKDPPPTVTFSGFGAAALDFRLSVFVESVADRGEVTNDVNMEIVRRFAEEGSASWERSSDGAGHSGHLGVRRPGDSSAAVHHQARIPGLPGVPISLAWTSAHPPRWLHG